MKLLQILFVFGMLTLPVHSYTSWYSGIPYQESTTSASNETLVNYETRSLYQDIVKESYDESDLESQVHILSMKMGHEAQYVHLFCENDQIEYELSQIETQLKSIRALINLGETLVDISEDSGIHSFQNNLNDCSRRFSTSYITLNQLPQDINEQLISDQDDKESILENLEQIEIALGSIQSFRDKHQVPNAIQNQHLNPTDLMTLSHSPEALQLKVNQLSYSALSGLINGGDTGFSNPNLINPNTGFSAQNPAGSGLQGDIINGFNQSQNQSIDPSMLLQLQNAFQQRGSFYNFDVSNQSGNLSY